MNDKQLSKLLSLVLRHKPSKIGIAIDKQGWTDIDVLIRRAQMAGFSFSRADVERVVEENDKQRFTIKDNLIRANQGHSIDVDLGLKAVRPPAHLYHGTTTEAYKTIKNEGLKKMSRQHVHLSADIKTADAIGARRNKKTIIIIVKSRKMEVDGFKFFLSDNNVWLTDHVPPEYILTTV